MEEEVVRTNKKPKVSLFKKRKKQDIRPFVKQQREVKFRKILHKVLASAGGILFVVFVLFLLRSGYESFISSRSVEIVNPSLNTVVDNSTIIDKIDKSKIGAEAITISSSSSNIVFKIDKANILLTREKNIDEQIKVLKNILRQFSLEGKTASSIDLRYNKPIVKF